LEEYEKWFAYFNTKESKARARQQLMEYERELAEKKDTGVKV
jgi:hypothetical protein